MVRELQVSPLPSTQYCSVYARQTEVASRCDGGELDWEVGKQDLGSASSPPVGFWKLLNISGLQCFHWKNEFTQTFFLSIF